MKQFLLLVMTVSLVQSSLSVAHGDDDARLEFFEKKIRPVLVEHCYACHSGAPDEVEAKLWLDSKEGWTRGGAVRPVDCAWKSASEPAAGSNTGNRQRFVHASGRKTPSECDQRL